MTQFWKQLPKDREIILYCGGGDCPLSTQAAQLLIWNGYPNVKILTDGIEGWKKMGLPTEQMIPPAMAVAQTWDCIPDSEIKLISANYLKKRLDNREDLLVIDVRSGQDYQQGHIPGAIAIPFGQLEGHLNNLPQDKDIIVYCGGLGCPLSQRAAKFLMWHGYQNVWELDDGTHAWQAAGFPLEK